MLGWLECWDTADYEALTEMRKLGLPDLLVAMIGMIA